MFILFKPGTVVDNHFYGGSAVGGSSQDKIGDDHSVVRVTRICEGIVKKVDASNAVCISPSRGDRTLSAI
jgi:hypothetical protein